jgi:hypothetical protein
MTKGITVIRKQIEGLVEYNDGEFAEIKTGGIDGVDEGILMGMMQTHREDTSDTPEEFQRRFPVGAWLNILTITEINIQVKTRGRAPPRS